MSIVFMLNVIKPLRSTMRLVRKWDRPSRISTSLIQVIFALIIYYLIFEYTTAAPVKTKRNPLEVGLISFNDAPKFRPPKTNLTKHHHRNSIKVGHSHHTWIPGYVRGHAFIPAHEEQVFIPMHEVIVAHPISVQSNKVYRCHIGGFGVGVDFGGRGGGHGFHISTYHL